MRGKWENSIASIVEPRRRRKLQSSRSRLLPSSHTNARVDKAGALLEAIGELEDSVESLKANSQCMSHGSMNTNKDAAAIDSQGNPTSASGSFLARETAPQVALHPLLAFKMHCPPSTLWCLSLSRPIRPCPKPSVPPPSWRTKPAGSSNSAMPQFLPKEILCSISVLVG